MNSRNFIGLNTTVILYFVYIGVTNSLLLNSGPTFQYYKYVIFFLSLFKLRLIFFLLQAPFQELLWMPYVWPRWPNFTGTCTHWPTDSNFLPIYYSLQIRNPYPLLLSFLFVFVIIDNVPFWDSVSSKCFSVFL